MTEPVRLSESHLWKDLKQFYETEGVAVWTSDRIPFFATNNPALAKTYCALFAAHLRDHQENRELNLTEPAYLIELGGGTGRMAFLILKRLQQLRERLPVKVIYLLTDYSSRNIAYYRSHRNLAPFVASGDLIIEQCDAETGEGLKVPDANPIFVIANYLFDSLSQDGFRIKDGILYEALCAKSDDDSMAFSFRESAKSVYHDEDYDLVLDEYRNSLGNTHFPFPIGPLRSLKAVSSLSKNRVALVMADKCLRTPEDLLGFDNLPVQRHEQGFSMSVNCHALDTVWLRQGGVALHSSPRSNPLHLALYCKGLDSSELGNVRDVFHSQIDEFGALDYLDFRAHLVNSETPLSLPLSLKLLRLSNWDAELFYEMSNELGEAGLSASLEEQRELFDAVVKCWENFYPIGDERDVPFATGRVLACINQFEQAVWAYGESLRLFGEKPLTYHNRGICRYNLSQLEAALEDFQTALAIDSNYGPSKELIIRTSAEIERRNQLGQ